MPWYSTLKYSENSSGLLWSWRPIKVQSRAYSFLAGHPPPQQTRPSDKRRHSADAWTITWCKLLLVNIVFPVMFMLMVNCKCSTWMTCCSEYFCNITRGWGCLRGIKDGWILKSSTPSKAERCTCSLCWRSWNHCFYTTPRSGREDTDRS